MDLVATCAYCRKPTHSPDPNYPWRFCNPFCAHKAGYYITYEYDSDGEPVREIGLIARPPKPVDEPEPLPSHKSRHFPLLLDKPPQPDLQEETTPGLAEDVSCPTVPTVSSVTSVPSVPTVMAVPAITPASTGPTVIPYPGNIEEDAAAWNQAGVRYDRKASRLLNRTDMLVLAGHGAGITVNRDALIVREGRTHYPQDPPTHRLERGQHTIRRIVITNSTGSLSLPAIDWCKQQGISILILGYDGSVQSAIGADEQADAKLRRAQYMAATTGRDREIARAILDRKIRGQLKTLLGYLSSEPGADRAQDMLKAAHTWLTLDEPPTWLSTISSMRLYEGKLATIYFVPMRTMRLRWYKLDTKRIPPHWLLAGPRHSLLSGNKASRNARHATSPFHAILNYSYGVLEGSCRLALSSLGFDTTAGFLHADMDRRDSLVYDLMELERPSVDALVIDLVRRWTLHFGDFTRVHDGSVKLHPQLCRAVVAACRIDQAVVERHAIWLARLVVEEVSTNER